jgi:hypothetical protein
MRLSRIPLFLYLLFKSVPRSSEDHAVRNLILKGSKRKGLAFLKRSEAKDGLVLAKRNKGGRERKRSRKTGELFPGKREGVFNL